MAGFTWILTFLCVAGRHQSSASPVLHSTQVVQVGQNVTLTCNLTSSAGITWYLLRSDQLMPLLTVTQSHLEQHTVDFYSVNNSRINNRGDVERGLVSLEILVVEEEDAGLYFCTGRCAGRVCVNGGILLDVNGVDGQLSRGKMREPCWSLGFCVVPPLLVLVFILMVGVYLCSGKPAVCCCDPVRGDSRLRVTEDVSLHYSSLRHADQPCPSGQGRTGFVKEDVTYSTVTSRKNPNGSHDHR